MNRTQTSRARTSRARWARPIVVTVMVAAMLTMAASAAFAVGKPTDPKISATTAIGSCRALLSGTLTTGSRAEAVAQHNCAVACGLLSDGRRATDRTRQNSFVVLVAASDCAQSCSFILAEAQIGRPGGHAAYRRADPISVAAAACFAYLATTASAGAGLPVIDTGGRTWR